MDAMGMTRFIRIMAGLLLMVLLAGCGGGGGGSGRSPSAEAEELGAVKVSGRILDGRGFPVPGATVTITNDPSVETASNQWGEFSATVTPGVHILTAIKDNGVLFTKKFTAREGFTSHLGDLSPQSPYLINGDDSQASEEETAEDTAEISAFWKSFAALYATEPTDAALKTWFATHTSADFLESGLNRSEVILELEAEADSHVGRSITVTITGAADVPAPYTKGYLVRVNGLNSEESAELMAFDGSKWLWCGDGRWMEISIRSHATMWMGVSGSATYSSGFELSLENGESNYAYHQGVRSAIVTGPGLPASGLFFEYRPGDTWLTLHGTSGSYYALSDAAIGSIPENAEYAFTLYADPAEDLMENENGGTVLQVYKETVRRPPVPQAQLNPSLFAALLEPSGHDLSTVNFGGLIPVSWTVPQDTTSGEVLLMWSAGGESYELEYDNDAGDASIVMDTTGYPEPDGWAGLFIRVTDSYGRDFNLGWFF